MPQKLEVVQAGDPILRQVASLLSAKEIRSKQIQDLIADIRYTNADALYGVGLAAPQVGHSIALSVIGIKPTPNRPNLEPFDQVIINPEYTGIGELVGMWEGCQSGGKGSLFAQAMRFNEIEAQWDDENGKHHTEKLCDFVAHVFQHEADHTKGILFFDRVVDTQSYMTDEEYRKRIVSR